jgi:EF-P beta-lysylation protein EpmB
MTSVSPHPRIAVPDWQQALANAIRDPAELLASVGIDPGRVRLARGDGARFPLRVPRGYVARMREGDPDDPLLRQVLPLDEEDRAVAGYGPDPVGDLKVVEPGGILHKYRGRVLLMTTGACAVHCRYCFRRAFPYARVNAAAGEWRQTLQALAASEDVEEVILSGGDPLSLSDRRLAALAEGLARIPHLQRLRVHSRLPVVLPERVTGELLDWFAGSRLKPVLVLHANHANELNSDVAGACERLASAGVTLLNQSVLLRGVNDDTETLARLSERLFDSGVLPYYLHLLDPVAGAAHFDVSERRARDLMVELAARLPGYLVPRLVREESGRAAKTWIGWDHV